MRRRSAVESPKLAEAEDLLETFNPDDWPGDTPYQQYEAWFAAVLERLEGTEAYRRDPFSFYRRFPPAPFDPYRDL